MCLKVEANRHEGWGVEGGELARTGEGAGGPGPGSTMSATPSMAEGEEGQATRRKCSDVVLLRLQDAIDCGPVKLIAVMNLGGSHMVSLNIESSGK